MPIKGVILIVEVIADVVRFIPENAGISEDPDAAIPVAVLLFVQLNVAPLVPEKITAFVISPLQTV